MPIIKGDKERRKSLTCFLNDSVLKIVTITMILAVIARVTMITKRMKEVSVELRFFGQSSQHSMGSEPFPGGVMVRQEQCQSPGAPCFYPVFVI